jgi:hypothetical protein
MLRLVTYIVPEIRGTHRIKLQRKSIIFSDDIKSFVERSNLPKDTLDRIYIAIQHVEEFLKSQNEEYKITPELSIDPKEGESEEIKIKIQLKKTLIIYSKLRSQITVLLSKHFQKKYYEILIKLEPF